MKKTVAINLGNLGSTGAIMRGVADTAASFGFETVQAYPERFDNRPKADNDLIICSDFWRRVYEKLAYYTGYNGCFSMIPTLRLLKKIDRIKPDILHFHNLHNSYINLPLLFRYVKKHDIKVVWTLHDCWSFTGQCPHFTMTGCDRWLTGCRGCSEHIEYPKSIYHNAEKMFKLKKKWFTGVENMTIVTPSQWLADLVGRSFLQEYPVKVINNGIDLGEFYPCGGKFRDAGGITAKYIILGVAFVWGKSKGLDVFTELARRLGSDYRIVLVGTNSEIDKDLPDNILSVHRTQNRRELAEIYSAADVFVNPTREENFPTVNMEALACGTPVITFRTGGSPEIIDEKTGAVVERDDIDALVSEIRSACETHKFAEDDCVERAKGFAMKDRFVEYADLYRALLG